MYYLKMDEFLFIQWIRNRQKKSKNVICGIGDDCAVINTSKDNLCLITTDMLVDGTHFNLKKHDAADVGRKAIACSISDIASMGCKPSVAVISVCFPQGTKNNFAKRLYAGIWEIADKYAIDIVGGDIISGKGPFCINVTMLGKNEGLRPIYRSGAKAGDKILVTGKLGGSLLDKHMFFEPRLNEGLKLNKNFTVHAMIDISDGLTADLNHILEESGVGAILFEDKIPVSDDALKMSKKTGNTALHHAFSDGEDYELLAVLPKLQAKKVQTSGLFQRGTISCIGEIIEDHGIWLKNLKGKLLRVQPKGYKHS
ncbi:MAG: thiamine-monophosphate kinase [Candidatus Kuenenia sp.]|nr:thiamine-monophosphate kinase [Candidatus Kuenenia hertensis]